MKANTYQGREEDIAAMLDSLHELFQESGDNVTATLVAGRMEQKLHRHVHHSLAAHLYKLIGFDSVRGNGHTDTSKYYIIPDPKLLEEKRAQFGKITSNNKRGGKV